MDNSKMILSVNQINEYIRALVDGDAVLSAVAVRGEISNLTFHRSGHIYFTLKDAEGVLKAVMFRSAASRVKFALKEGMSIIAFGRISVYAPSGQYQLYTEEIQPDGVGALYIAFEQIKKKLADEGLFDESRKKKIPKLPMTVGIITSPTGAAIHDMINVMGRRSPITKLLLYPALVQGEGAPKSLMAGLKYFNSQKNVDVIIIGRGGGSMEDLWGFNSAELAYEIASSEIPIISAVGHESDFTICDFVADLRAPTPSAAAELAVPNLEDVKITLDADRLRMKKALLLKLENYRRYIGVLSSARVLTSRESLLDEYKMKINLISDSLDRLIKDRIREGSTKLSLLSAKLNAISPLATLSRGYAIVRSLDGGPIKNVSDVKKNDRMRVYFSDGEIEAEVKEINKKQKIYAREES